MSSASRCFRFAAGMPFSTFNCVSHPRTPWSVAHCTRSPLKRLAYEVKPVDLRAGAQATAPFMEMNPQGLVPCLVDDEIFLTQSLSIIEYLDERYPLPALLPAQPILRARARAAALAIACDIH
ncbi:glutathione S-transferase N-terminal domain-containing protein, partial [Parvibaculum sp.]|uniref:glutathione S-transferase N-terminal domain-containing protein n=1 Tax=Parvibaculum sp. TaxID=2024848 RepID=UPI002B6B256B